jgi:hypothetical protein
MKRNGLRALGLATCVAALFSLIGLAVDVNNIVENELIEEISNAAGLALVGDYTLKTVEELEELATGRTSGIRLAADRALFIVTGREIELFEMEDDALLALAEAGDQDAADMWFFHNRADFKRPEKLEAYLLTGVLYQDEDGADVVVEADTLAIAAGKLLGGFYLPGSPLGAMTEGELVELAKNGESLGLRVAAATALTAFWIAGQPLTIDQTLAEILSVTMVYPELALAYQGYLAYLFSL